MLGTTEILLIVGVGMFLFGSGKIKAWAKELKEVKSEWEKPNVCDSK